MVKFAVVFCKQEDGVVGLSVTQGEIYSVHAEKPEHVFEWAKQEVAKMPGYTFLAFSEEILALPEHRFRIEVEYKTV